MYTGEVVEAGAGMGTDLSVSVRASCADSDPGILEVTLVNARGVPVGHWPEDGCPHVVVEFQEHLSTTDAPFTLQIKSCPAPNSPSMITTAGPFLMAPPTPPQGHPVCNPLRTTPPTQACVDAQRRANAAASDAEAACDQVRYWRSQRDTDAAIATAAFVAMAGFITAAMAAGFWLVQVILWALAAISAAVGIVYSILAAQANSHYFDYLGRVNEARQRYRDAMIDVRANCCPDQGTVLPITDCST